MKKFALFCKFQHKRKANETCHCVTGMLLELPVPVVRQMLKDEATLTTAVEKALRALQGAQESNSRYTYTQLFVG